MIKRIISVLIALTLCYSFSVTTFAVTVSDKDEIFISSNGDIYSKASRFSSNSIRITKEKSFENIYISPAGKYYMQIDGNNYIPVQELTLPLNSYQTYSTLKSYGFPTEILDDVAAMAAYVDYNNGTNVQITTFIPDSNSRSNILPRISTNWNGKRFYHYQIYFTGLTTGYVTVKSGSAVTESFLSSLKDITVMSMGLVLEEVGLAMDLFDLGQSCLEVFTSSTGDTPVYASSENKVQVRVTSTLFQKYTYYYDEALDIEMLGCITQKALVNKIDTSITLKVPSGAETVDTTRTLSRTYESLDYSNPESNAYTYRYAPLAERLCFSISGLRISYNTPYFDWPSNWPNP